MSSGAITVSIQPTLAAQASAFAQRRHCSLEELATEALSEFIGANIIQTPEVQLHLERAMQLGLTPDEYAVRMVKQVRAEIRREQEQQSPS